MKKTHSYAFMALLMALEIILTRFVQIPFTFLGGFVDKISLGFLPVALAGSLFGIGGGALVGGLADILRAVIFPQGGVINPLFTITAALRGGVYGAFYKNGMSFVKILISTAIIFVINVLLVGFFISISYGNPYYTVIITRLPTSAVQSLVQLLILCFVGNPIERKLRYVRK